MKLKYQMRGLGIGIVVTALLMGVATKDGLPLSDAEIRAKALTLGMVDSDSLKLTDIQNASHPSGATPAPADGSEGEEGDAPQNGTAAPDEASGDDSGESGGNASAEGEADAAQTSGAGTGSDKETQGSGTGEDNGSEETDRERGDGTVTVRIETGMNSYGASVVIAEAGLVEDAAAFDRYLCNEGYSRKIADGTYEIPFGATEEEIAKIITKGR